MEHFITLAADPNAQQGGAGSLVVMLLVYAVFFGALWFFMIRPQSKKRKKEEAMRKNAQIGDEVTTIGGIMGRIVSIKEDTNTIILETGTDRTKIKLRRDAINSVETVHDDAE